MIVKMCRAKFGYKLLNVIIAHYRHVVLFKLLLFMFYVIDQKIAGTVGWTGPTETI